MVGEDPMFRLTLTLSWAYVRAGDYQQAVRYADKAAAKTKGVDVKSYVFALGLVGDAYEAMGAQEKAMACFDEAATLSIDILSREPDDYFTCIAICSAYAGMGRICMKAGDAEKATCYLAGLHGMTSQAAAIEDAHPVAKQELLRLHTLSCKYICELYLKLGKVADAQPHVAEFFELATRLHEMLPNDEDIKMKLMLANICQGDVLRLAGTLNESYPFYFAANQLADQLAGNYERNYEFQTASIVAMENLGNWHYTNGEFQEALHFYQQQYAIAQALHQKDKAGLHKTLNFLIAGKHLGDVFTGMKQYAEAELYLIEALESGTDLVQRFSGSIECGYSLGIVYESLYRLYAYCNQQEHALHYCRGICDLFSQLSAAAPDDTHYRETLEFYEKVLQDLLANSDHGA